MNLASLAKVGAKITRLGYRTGVIQNAPKILLGAGLIISGVGIVKTCKSTLKAQDIIEEHKEQRAHIDEATKIFADENAGAMYPERNRDIATLYFQTGKKIVKEYSTGIGLIAVGTASILCSFKVLNGRYLTSVSAYNSIHTAYNNYRKRVRDTYGPEVDKQFAQGIYKSDKIIEESKKKEIITEYDVDFDTSGSPYLYVFNEETSDAYIMPSKYYGMSARANRLAVTTLNINFLIKVKEELTKRLQIEGYLLLNDALMALGMKRIGSVIINGKKVKAGNIGWVYPTDENGNYIGPGDGFVDFGILDYDKATGSENWTIIDNLDSINNPFIVNYKTGDIIIDFNVDGDISDYLITHIPFRKNKSTARIKA